MTASLREFLGLEEKLSIWDFHPDPNGPVAVSSALPNFSLVWIQFFSPGNLLSCHIVFRPYLTPPDNLDTVHQLFRHFLLMFLQSPLWHFRPPTKNLLSLLLLPSYPHPTSDLWEKKTNKKFTFPCDKSMEKKFLWHHFCAKGESADRFLRFHRYFPSFLFYFLHPKNFSFYRKFLAKKYLLWKKGRLKINTRENAFDIIMQQFSGNGCTFFLI